jgi:hypothetical protein
MCYRAYKKKIAINPPRTPNNYHRPNRAEPTTTPLQCDVKSAANGTAAFGRVKLFRV